MVKKMSEKQTLEDISRSLTPKIDGVKEHSPNRAPTPMPIVAFDFSKISRQLQQLIDENKRKNNLLQTFTQIDFDVKTLVDQSNVNLKKMEQISSQVDARLKVVDTLEAKWNLLMQRVSSVLDELERVLRQM
jgi:hypothetical protein